MKVRSHTWCTTTCSKSILVYYHVFKSILVYYFVLFIIDCSGIMNLWGENYVRRLINMYRRRDPLVYENILDPWCVKYSQIINDADVAQLNNIRLHDKRDIPWLSRAHTTTIYYKDLTTNDQDIIDRIKQRIKAAYERKIGKKLYDIHHNSTNVYIYHGKHARHLWHVDPQNVNTIYNGIVCIDRRGDISPLQWKDINKRVHSVHLDIGDAALFNGGTTIHQVPPNNDPTSKRTVLSIAFTSEEKLILRNKTTEFDGNNMCTYIAGGSNVLNCLKMMLGIFITVFVLSKLSNAHEISYTFLITYMSCVIVLVKYLPLHYDTGLGTGRSSSIRYNVEMLVLVSIMSLNVKGAILFLSYFLLSDQFFPRVWVSYN